MKKKKDTEPMDAMDSELEAKELPEEEEDQDGNQTDEAEEDVLEEFDLSIPGDEEEGGQGPAGAPAGAEAETETKAAEPVEIQGPPPPPAVQVARGRVPEAQPPKAYIRPRPDAGSLSYGSRAALYLRDKDEYRSMIGGNKQWK